MFMARDMEEAGYALEKVANVVIWGHSTTPGINFGCTNGSGNPANKVFEDTLVELVKNIRHNGVKDMGVGKVDPEGFNDGFDACCKAGLEVAGRISVKGIQCLKDYLKVTEFS